MLSLWLSGQLSCYLIGYPGSYPADPSVLGVCYHFGYPGSYRAITLAIRGAILLIHSCYDLLSLWLSGQLSCYVSGYPGSYRAISLAIRVAILQIHRC